MNTVEAKEIEGAKYHGPTPLTVNDGVVIGVEKFRDIWFELLALIGRHYQETEATYLSDPYDPNIMQYQAMEDAGQTAIFTMRHEGILVGYLMFNVYRGLHSREMLQAREFAWYIAPEYRGKKLAPQCLTYAEKVLSALGCTLVGMSSKAFVGGADVGPFLERCGYQPVAVYYVKKLE